MKTKLVKTIAAIILLLLGLSLSQSGTAASSWRSGRAISATLSGYGSANYTSKQPANQSEIWWNHCIASDGQFYSVVSREKPEVLGLTEHSTIRFSERRDRIYILGPTGKRFSLRLIRKDQAEDCP